MRPDKQVRQRGEVRQEIGNRAALEREDRMRDVGVGESVRAENVEAEHRLDVDHRSEFPRVDAPADLTRRVVEQVVVVLDQRAPEFPGAAGQHVQFFQRGRGRLLHDHVGAGLQRIEREMEVRSRRRGDVNNVRSDLTQHDAMVGKPAADPVPLSCAFRHRRGQVAEGDDLHTRQSLETRQVLARDLSRPDQCRSHVQNSSRGRARVCGWPCRLRPHQHPRYGGAATCRSAIKAGLSPTEHA